VPPDFRTAITEKVMGVDSLLARTDQLTSASNSITLPKDETTPWQSTGGIQAFWEGEGSLITQSKVALEQTTIRLNKLTALVPVTEELLEDASALSTYINRKAPQKFDYKIQNAIINGTGAGQPKGILASDALVEVAKESGQVADTVLAQNITNMWARMYAPSRSNAIWLINQDVEPQLDYLQMPGTNPTAPLFMPAGGLSASPFATLKGRPVVPVEACKTLGDVGDIILADLTQYMTAMKTGGIRQDVSMHLWFDYDTLAFRFILRMAGLPWWGSAIQPANGSNTLSCFVSLAARG
jgi:HK97 family phage major capsid protein